MVLNIQPQYQNFEIPKYSLDLSTIGYDNHIPKHFLPLQNFVDWNSCQDEQVDLLACNVNSCLKSPLSLKPSDVESP